MEIFVTVRELLQFLGIGQVISPNTKIKNNIRRIMCFLILLSAVLSGMWFVIFEAKTFAEYAKPLLFVATVIVAMLFFLILLQQSERFENLFDEFLSKIQERMLFS